MSKKKLKIMVSSTVYGSESDLDAIYNILDGFGYEVVMSKEGNVYVPAGHTPKQACLKAVEDCDLFFGIVFPRYGSGITHEEFLKAEELREQLREQLKKQLRGKKEKLAALVDVIKTDKG